MSSSAHQQETTRIHQFQVLADLETFVEAETAAHLQRRRLWFPNDLSAADAEGGKEQEEKLRHIRETARQLPDAVRVALAINLLTEEGLPHFHRLIATHFRDETPWRIWNNMWTAEEDRHGCALRDYVRDARLFDMGALERMQYAYIESGFNPEWEYDPYRLLAYTSLQERATQMAHANTGRSCAPFEPHIQRVLAHVAGDESRHFMFYRNVFTAILEHDPENALHALVKVMPALAMPGHTIPDYGHMSEVMRRADIYGPRHYQMIVEELLEHWKIGMMTKLSGYAAQCQEKLMRLPARLARMTDYLEAKASPREFHFGFLYNRPLVV